MPEAESHLLVERRDGIMILTMNRPEVRNSLSPQMLVELAAAWHEFRDTKDLRVAAEHATFGTPETQVGLLPGGGSLTRLPRQIPYCKAVEMLMLGESFSAQEALEMGLLNYVVPKEQLMDKALALAKRLSANGPLAVQKVKEGIMRSSGLTLEKAYQVESEVSAVVMQSKDAREDPRAFKEKRKPNFIGE